MISSNFVLVIVLLFFLRAWVGYRAGHIILKCRPRLDVQVSNEEQTKPAKQQDNLTFLIKIANEIYAL